jgi:beta-1,4-mannooligosaccharide phosphorylase
MSRSDRESNSIVYSDHPFVWTDSALCQRPARPWEALQLGNCGPPIETEAGWLVLTHGVGPMRTYHIGAILLDLEDPTRILGQLQEPLLSPAADEQDGYVPNVVLTFLAGGSLPLALGFEPPRGSGYGFYVVAGCDGQNRLAARCPATTRPLIERCDLDRCVRTRRRGRLLGC